MKLTVIMPVYNEAHTIERAITQVLRAPLPAAVDLEIIIVDDGSTDGTQEILQQYRHRSVAAVFHARNRGKGAAFRTGLERATGDFVVVQDADLEYSPEDYPKLLQPVLEGVADVVYGSRFLTSGPHRVLYYWHYLANAMLTTLSNMFTNLNLSDMETGYKLFRREILERITLEENRFGFEPEITSKLARIRGIRIYEVGISYFGRTYAEGKKISWKDGLRAVYCILKYGLRK